MPCKLGDWSYAVTDTKLARETKSGTILQLYLYSDRAARVQGEPPENMHVVPPWTEFKPQTYRVDDYSAYYWLVRDWLEKADADDDATHGMEFLYSLNRLNVATSRARYVSVLMGSPAPFAPECRTPRQMRLANGSCRYRELAGVV